MADEDSKRKWAELFGGDPDNAVTRVRRPLEADEDVTNPVDDSQIIEDDPTGAHPLAWVEAGHSSEELATRVYNPADRPAPAAPRQAEPARKGRSRVALFIVLVLLVFLFAAALGVVAVLWLNRAETPELTLADGENAPPAPVGPAVTAPPSPPAGPAPTTEAATAIEPRPAEPAPAEPAPAEPAPAEPAPAEPAEERSPPPGESAPGGGDTDDALSALLEPVRGCTRLEQGYHPRALTAHLVVDEEGSIRLRGITPATPRRVSLCLARLFQAETLPQGAGQNISHTYRLTP